MSLDKSRWSGAPKVDRSIEESPAFDIRMPDESNQLASSGTKPFNEYPKFDPYEEKKRQVVEYTYKGKKVKVIIDPTAGGFRIEARVGRKKTAYRWANVRQRAFEDYYSVIDQSNQYIDKGFV